MLRSGAHATNAHFRLDIQGLRTVAVLAVVLYHAGVPTLTGGYVGVDVFFVISGFLITGLLIRELERTGRVSLSDFWARRARRILPAAALTLAVVAILTIIIFPITRWEWTGVEISASAAYVVNWLFAVKSTDYLAGDDSASPVQHFWSLAVEEQFYLVWPALIVIALVVVTKLKWTASARRLVGVLASAIVVASFAWSVIHTSPTSSDAYFVTTTRLWELAIGALLAAIAPSLRYMNKPTAAVLGWAGVIAIIYAVVTFNEHTVFPGWAAIVPVLGTVLIIGAGEAAGFRGPAVILSTKPMVWVGDRSYSLYLFHWPFIVFATVLAGHSDLWVGLLAAGISVVVASYSYRLVERPVLAKARLWKRPIRTSLLSGAALTVVGLVVGGGLFGSVRAITPQPPEAVAMLSAGYKFGALSVDAEDDSGSLLLGPLAAQDDFNQTCPSTPVSSAKVSECRFGNEDAETNVLLIGDSKMRQWVGAFRIIADQRNWKVVTYLKDSCPFISTDVSRNGAVYTECAEWNERVRRYIAEDDYDLVVTSNNMREGVTDGGAPLSDASSTESIESIAEGLDIAWHEFTDEGTPVVVISDGPNMGFDVPDCVATPSRDPGDCSVPASVALAHRGESQRIAAAGNPLVHLIDVSDWLCDEDCAPVSGEVVVYLDTSHVTNTYAVSLVPALTRALDDGGAP